METYKIENEVLGAAQKLVTDNPDIRVPANHCRVGLAEGKLISAFPGIHI